jgi:hypothetical protein
MWGTTQETAFLANTATVAAPQFVALAAQIGTNAVSTSAEGVGVALADDPQFQPFLDLNATDFAAAVAVATGVNVGVINGWVAFWTTFATNNPTVLQPGVTVQEFAYGATFGDAIGVALQNPTSANLQTTVTTNAQGELIIGGDVANDLLTIATGQYQVGIDCDLLPQHDPLQGEAGSGPPVDTLILTPLVDSPTQGFSTGNGGSFANLATGGTFIADPAANPPLGTTNTLNASDDLQGSQDGSSILELNTIDSSFFGANDPFAQTVTMNNVGTANILNNADDDDPAGFAGDITGLTTVNIEGGSNPNGLVQLGQNGQGLNTALTTVNINAGEFTPNTPPLFDDGNDGSDLEIWIESSAFAGGEALDLTLGADSGGPGTGGIGAVVDLNVTGGANFYNVVNVTSQGPDANHLHLETNADTITDVVVLGEGDLEICGSALNQDTLTLFDSTASVAGQSITAFFEGGNPGDVTANGGAGDENFTFLTFDDLTGETTFTDTDSVDGGGGDNKLTLQAFQGALLGAGVGPNIVNIDTIVHTTFINDCFDDCNYTFTDDVITVDMDLAGSANILELQGDYDNIVDGVTVNNLTNAQTVIYSGINLFDLNLEASGPLGDVNLTMAQDECVQEFFPGTTTHLIFDVNLISGGSLNINSIGVADLNQIIDLDDVDADMVITGDVDLSLGSKAAPYDFDGGVVDASAFEGNLTLYIGDGSQTVFAGLGDDNIDLVTQDAGEPDLIDLSAGGSDTVIFEDTNNVSDDITSDNYTTVTGFDLADDTIAIDVTTVASAQQIDLQETDGDDVAPGDAVNFYGLTPGINDNLAGEDINYIAIQANNNSSSLSLQGYFNLLIGATTIGVDNNADLILMGMFDNFQNNGLVLFTVEPGGDNQIDSGDDVDMVAIVNMSFTDFLDFGTTGGLSFVDFPAV